MSSYTPGYDCLLIHAAVLRAEFADRAKACPASGSHEIADMSPVWAWSGMRNLSAIIHISKSTYVLITTCVGPEVLGVSSNSLSTCVYMDPINGRPSPMKTTRTTNFLIAEPRFMFLNSTRL